MDDDSKLEVSRRGLLVGSAAASVIQAARHSGGRSAHPGSGDGERPDSPSRRF